MESDPKDVSEMILKSLNDVGKNKAVGYLPIATIQNTLNLDILELEQKFVNQGLCVKILGEGPSCIKSGAFFVFDRSSVEKAIKDYDLASTNEFAIPDSDALIEKIASVWFEENHPITPLIKKLFGEK